MAQLAKLPDDTVFYTQITMEAAEDPSFLAAMSRAHIRGALVGVESVTQAGLKDVYKGFNLYGEALATRLQAFKRAGVHVLGSFIFGLPSDRAETFEETAAVAERAGVTFAQFVMLSPFPGTVDFAKWEKEMEGTSATIGSTACRTSGRAHGWSSRTGRESRSCSSQNSIDRCTPIPVSRPTAPGWRDRRSGRDGSRPRAGASSSPGRCRSSRCRPSATGRPWCAWPETVERWSCPLCPQASRRAVRLPAPGRAACSGACVFGSSGIGPGRHCVLTSSPACAEASTLHVRLLDTSYNCSSSRFPEPCAITA